MELSGLLFCGFCKSMRAYFDKLVRGDIADA